MPLPEDTMFFGYADKLTEEQKSYVDSIFDNQLTMVNAKSGSGKTTLAVAAAKLIGKELLYVFSPVEEGKMGFRPGSQRDKESSYYQPLKDALMEINENPDQVIYDENNLERQKNGDFWVFPMSHIFARGTNIKNKTLIIDEAQNFTKGELKKLLTRVHSTTTVIMIGHSEQNDLSNPNKSGFMPYIEWFKDEEYAFACELSVNFRGKLANHADKLSWA